MQNSSLILLSLFAIGCSNPKVFVLNEKEESRYFVQRLVSTSFEKDLIGESPLVVINGTSFKYNKKTRHYLIATKKARYYHFRLLKQKQQSYHLQ